MVTARVVGGSAYQEAIEKMDGELTKVIEDFMRAVDVETLRLAKKSGKHKLSHFGVSANSVNTCRPKRARANGAKAFDPAA